MLTASRKAKGRRLQKWVQEFILELFPELTDRDVRSASMGVTGEDIQFSQRAKEKIDLSIECKNRARVAIYKDFKQACGHGANPCLIVKADGERPLAVVDAEFFFRMVRDRSMR